MNISIRNEGEGFQKCECQFEFIQNRKKTSCTEPSTQDV